MRSPRAEPCRATATVDGRFQRRGPVCPASGVEYALGPSSRRPAPEQRVSHTTCGWAHASVQGCTASSSSISITGRNEPRGRSISGAAVRRLDGPHDERGARPLHRIPPWRSVGRSAGGCSTIPVAARMGPTSRTRPRPYTTCASAAPFASGGESVVSGGRVAEARPEDAASEGRSRSGRGVHPRDVPCTPQAAGTEGGHHIGQSSDGQPSKQGDDDQRPEPITVQRDEVMLPQAPPRREQKNARRVQNGFAPGQKPYRPDS